MPSMPTRKRPHIGVLISSLEESCQSKIWQGIEDCARQSGVDVTAYLSTFQQKDGMLEEHYSVVFDAVAQNRSLDGLILFGGFIAEDIGTENVASFIQRCTHIPIVSLAMSFPDAPETASLQTDNRTGIYETVLHMITKHNHRRIAFVKGPEDHEEARARFDGYCDALQFGGISFDASLVLPGHFSDWSGEEAVVELLDHRQKQVDSIVCADDESAIGVINELTRRGIAVPRDIAVCGFDDAEYADIISPSLTTARQPFYEMGRESVNHPIDRIQMKSAPEQLLLHAEPVIRQSCGCVTDLPPILRSEDQRETIQKTMASHSERLFQSVPVSPSDRTRWAHLICDLIGDSFQTVTFLREVDRILIAYRTRTPDLAPWKLWFAIFQAELRTLSLTVTEYADRSEAILQAVQLVDSAEQRSRRYAVLKSGEDQWEVRGIAQSLGTSFNIQTLAQRLKNGASELGITTSLVFLYNEPCMYDKWVAPQYVTYVYGFNDRGEIRPDMHELLLPIGDIQELIAVEQRRHRCSLFYMPLFFGEEQIGVMLLEYNPKRPIDIYEPLRLNVSTALKGAALFEKIERQSITDEMTQLYNRRGFITFSLSRLTHLRRTETSSSLFFIDMDGLKAINDTHGHKEGDRAIKATAAILKETLREGDIIGRMGGDEFTVLASSVTERQTAEITRRLRKAFDEYNRKSNLPYTVGCSIGSQILTLYTEEAFEFALQKADELLYLEKSEKRKRGVGRA